MVGRRKEVEELEDLYLSGKAEFVAVYGRRRVGKTYLVDQVFEGRITFRHTGLSPIEGKEAGDGLLKAQLRSFYESMVRQGFAIDHCPVDWQEAFFMLSMALQDIDDGSRQLVFLDELPWMDTPRSFFMTALEGFWNGWACHRPGFMLIVCGSANSWILDKLVNNHGGLYGRLTYQIRLSPFSLGECEEYFKSNNYYMSRYDMVQSYMIVGGIPYYMGYMKRQNSLAQNVDEMFFSNDARLRDEFSRLFASIFDSPERAKDVVVFLSRRSAGYTRSEISEHLGISNGSTLSSVLNALIASDFVIAYVPFGLSKRQVHYKLIDPFCLFYLKFVDGHDSLADDFWLQNLSSQALVSWRGLAFENVCFNHVPQIKKALGISGVRTSQSAWSKRDGDTEGTQIDLLISRMDNVVNMCEIKFYNDLFTVDGCYYRTLMHRQNLLAPHLKRGAGIHNTLITTYGLVKNAYSGIFSNVVTMDDLFSN